MKEELIEKEVTNIEETISYPPDGINVTEQEKHKRYPDVFTEYRPNQVVRFEQKDQDFLFHCKNGISLWIAVLDQHMLRFRYRPDGKYPTDFSYAIDPNFSPKTVQIVFQEDPTHYHIQTDALNCQIAKTNLNVIIKDQAGNVLSEDDEGYFAKSTILKGFNEISLSKKAPAGEAYLGLGDKSGAMNLRGSQYVNWNTDAFAYGENTDPLYRTIPFYYGIRAGNSYGIFFDNPYKSHFDFAKTSPTTTRFWAEGGELNYYFFSGTNCDRVAQAYMDLTGRPELPPLWALGFHQCRWSYYPESRVKELAQEFRDRKIPCDAIYLDIDYMNEYRCFTWNESYFPDPKAMIQDLKDQGFRTVVMIDPGIKVDEAYSVYQEGIENDFFCKRADGDLMVGPVWPPACVFPDYTHPAVRSWWGALYGDLYNENGVSGFWNDMNEPAVFGVDSKTFPDDVRHHNEGQPSGHRKVHNIYGMQMARSTYEGLKTLQPQTRPFVITRASYSGGQRFSSVWTGDNVANWKHLEIANIQCQRLSISGFSFVGTDIGGFAEMPDGELMVRWLQLGVYHPLYRVHSMGAHEDGGATVDESAVKSKEKFDRMDQEPWAFGAKYTAHARKAIEWRYQLLPYLYTAFWQNCQTGVPLLKPLPFAYPKDKKAQALDRDFMFGEQLLVSPVLEEGAKKQNIYLPKGLWYHLNTGQVFIGNDTYTFDLQLSDIPLFIKAGAVLPLYPVQQYTSEVPIEQLQLKAFYNKGKMESQLYEDKGEDYAYREGRFSLKTLTTEGSSESFSIQQSKTGHHPDSYTSCLVKVYGLPFEVEKCSVDGAVVSVQTTATKDVTVYSLEVPNVFETIQFTALEK